jgi:hypothetical protein
MERHYFFRGDSIVGDDLPVIRYHRRFVLFVVLIAATPVAAQKPIPAGRDAPTRNAFFKKTDAEELAIGEVYARQTKDAKKLHESAKTFLVMVRSAGINKTGPGTSPKRVYKLGRELMAAGSTDPLVVAFTLRRRSNLEDWKKIQSLYLKAVSDVNQQYSPRYRILVTSICRDLGTKLYNHHRRRRRKIKPVDLAFFHKAFVDWMLAESESLDRQRHIWAYLEGVYMMTGAVDVRNGFRDLVDLSLEQEKRSIRGCATCSTERWPWRRQDHSLLPTKKATIRTTGQPPSTLLLRGRPRLRFRTRRQS